MKKYHRSIRSVLAVILTLAALTGSALAALPLHQETEPGIIEIQSARASNSFEVDVPAGEIVAADTSFSLAAGDTVEFNASYMPRSANLDVGLIAPDGLFYSTKAKNGKIDSSITVNERGRYTFAIRNNSNVTVSVTGFVDY